MRRAALRSNENDVLGTLDLAGYLRLNDGDF